ncbi:hypothetical protein [Burkholderia savannae]|uniref:hypothetical protein n=1 Tax=Burkholderia savannae TaxID=1637837 RepID=UPI0018D23ECC|nr:hypothetical protein [Burkholderia savannae]
MRAPRDDARGGWRSGATRWLVATHAHARSVGVALHVPTPRIEERSFFLGVGTIVSPSLLMHLPYDQGEGQHTIAMRVPALHRSKPRAPGATRDPLATNARRPARRAQLEQSSISPMRADAGYYRRECALRPPRRKRGDACRPRAHGLCAHGLCAMNDIRENSRYGAARERSPSLRAQATRFGASHVAVVRQASGHVRALWTVRVRRADRDSNPHGGNAANATRAPFRRRHAFLLLGRASRARRGRTEPMPVR